VACAENKLLLDQQAYFEFNEACFYEKFSLAGNFKSELELKWIVCQQLGQYIITQIPPLSSHSDRVLVLVENILEDAYKKEHNLFDDYQEETKALIGDIVDQKTFLETVSNSSWFNTTVVCFSDLVSQQSFPPVFLNALKRLKENRVPRWIILCNHMH
jgi:hypothetical protein